MPGHDNQPLVGHAPQPTVRQVLGALPQIVRSLRPDPDRPRFPKDANQPMPEHTIGDLLFDTEPAADTGREDDLVDVDDQDSLVPVQDAGTDTADEEVIDLDDVDDDGCEEVA